MSKNFKKVVSTALAVLSLMGPIEATAESPIDSSKLETLHRIERLTRLGDDEKRLQEYIETTASEEELNFVDLLENGAIFVLNTGMVDKGEGKDQTFGITGIEKAYTGINDGDEVHIEKSNDESLKLVYAKADTFKNASIEIPNGYKKCIALDHMQKMDEVGDYDFVHISPRINTNSLETKEIYTKEEYEQMLTIADKLTENVKDDDNDFVKMSKIYLNVIDYMTYDHESFSQGYGRDEASGNLKALLSGLGVCTAYTDIVYNLGQYKGVNVEPAVGQTDKSGHAWNVFHYTDKYGTEHTFGLDATYGDGDKNDLRNNFATNIFESSHSNYFTAGLPSAYCEEASKSNSGYGNGFIREFLDLVRADINIRPETVQELNEKGISVSAILKAKEENPDLFNGAVELNEDAIRKCASRYVESKNNNDLGLQTNNRSKNDDDRGR